MRMISSIEDDKLRLLTTIISRLCFRAAIWHPEREASETGVYTKARDVHSQDENRKLKVGMLVVCQTSGIHDWTVAFVEEVFATGAYGPDVMLREIGSNRLCRMGNESYYSIHGLSESDLFEGEKRKFFHLVVRTIGRLGDDWRRYGGLEFVDDKMCRVMIREKFGGMSNEFDSVPFSIEIRWNRSRLSMRQLMKELEAGGYSTKEFGRVPRAKPAGSTTFMEIGAAGVLSTTVQSGA